MGVSQGIGVGGILGQGEVRGFWWEERDEPQKGRDPDRTRTALVELSSRAAEESLGYFPYPVEGVNVLSS